MSLQDRTTNGIPDQVLFDNGETVVVDVPEEPDEPSEQIDAYDKLKKEKTISELLGLVDVDFTHYSEAWWSEREKQLADLKARDVVEAERERMRNRARDLIEQDTGTRARFPEMFVASAMDVPRDTPAMAQARMFSHLPSRILVLAGGVGTGKTTAATWVALKAIDRDPGFIRASELERRGRYDKTLDVWLRERTSLVIDDLGAEVLDGKGVFRSLLDEIVDMFYSRKRSLIITTNLRGKIPEGEESEPQFVERYGDRVRSRVKQIGRWADCGMVDLRSEATP